MNKFRLFYKNNDINLKIIGIYIFFRNGIRPKDIVLHWRAKGSWFDTEVFEEYLKKMIKPQ